MFDEETESLLAGLVMEFMEAVRDQLVLFHEGCVIVTAPVGAPPEYIEVTVDGINDPNVYWRGVPPAPAIGNVVTVWENVASHRREIFCAGGVGGVTGGGCTWDQVYDFGGAGAGRTAIVNAGAWQAQAPNGTQHAMELQREDNATNTALEILRLIRRVSGGVGANNLGATVLWRAEDNAGTEIDQAAIGASWRIAAAANPSGRLDFYAQNLGAGLVNVFSAWESFFRWMDGVEIDQVNGPAHFAFISDAGPQMDINMTSTTNNDVQNLLSLVRRTTNVANGAAGFGVRLNFLLEDNAGGTQEAGAIDVIWTNPASAFPVAYMPFSVAIAAGGIAESFRADSAGFLLAASKVVDLNGITDALVLSADGDTTISAPTDGQIDIETETVDVVRIIGASTDDISPWRLGGQVLNLDFTGLAFDTVAECNAVGLRFNDSDTPYPTTLAVAHTGGTWTHVAGNGWIPAAVTDNCGPSILIPLMRPGNWQLDLTLTYNPGNVNHQMYMYVGYVDGHNEWGAYARYIDANAAAHELDSDFVTNDGDDTGTVRIAGAILAGVGDRALGFRIKNACGGYYDPQAAAWQNYAGRGTAGFGYSAAYVFIQFLKVSAATFCTPMYLKNLKLTYLL